MDEFQWSAAASPELPSVIQGLWDGSWRHDDKVFLILCGSFVGFMEREVLGRESPLFGRRTGQIHLQPFGYREAAEFHPGYSLRDRATTYFVCGGVPLYLRAFSDRMSVEDNLAAQILDPHAPLHREPDFLVREELREVERYYGILLAVATGDCTPTAIASRTGVDVRQLAYYLQQLLDLGYLQRRRPLTTRSGRSQGVRYAIGDPPASILVPFPVPATQRHHAPRSASCAARVDQAGIAGLLGPVLRVVVPRGASRPSRARGRHRQRHGGRILGCAVADRRRRRAGRRSHRTGRMQVGQRVRSGRPILAELEAKVAAYPNPTNATVGLRVFTQGTVKPVPCAEFAVGWTSLADIYAE